MAGNFLTAFSCPKKLKESGVMGMNSRNYNIISTYNSRRLYPLVDDKVQTKILANKHGIRTPGLIGAIEFQHQVRHILDIVKGCKDFVDRKSVV